LSDVLLSTELHYENPLEKIILDMTSHRLRVWPPVTTDIHPAAISPLNLTYTRRSHAERTLLVPQQP